MCILNKMLFSICTRTLAIRILCLHRELQTTNRWLLSSQQLIPCTEPWNFDQNKEQDGENGTFSMSLFGAHAWVRDREVIDILYELHVQQLSRDWFHFPIETKENPLSHSEFCGVNFFCTIVRMGWMHINSGQTFQFELWKIQSFSLTTVDSILYTLELCKCIFSNRNHQKLYLLC